MDRRACQATVHGVTRVGHNLATKPPTTNVYEKMKALLTEITHGDCGFWKATSWLLPLGYCCSHPLGAW